MFCSKIQANQQRLVNDCFNNPDMNALNFTVFKDTEAMVALADRMFTLQKDFQSQGKDTHVDIGFHYTKSSLLHSIRQDGLLTKAERNRSPFMDQVPSNGGTFGDGLYLGNNPFSYHAFARGDICLFVARLKGQTNKFEERQVGDTTLLGRSGGTDEVCVLQSSAQALSLAYFSSDLIDPLDDSNAGNRMTHEYHCSLQAIVDEFFNDGQVTEVSCPPPSTVQRRQNIPQSLLQTSTVEYVAPERLSQAHDCFRECTQEVENQHCPICLDSFSSDAVQLIECGHTFHKRCILECLEVSSNCPVCRQPLSLIQGSSPSGTMSSYVQRNMSCLGYERGTIVITYTLSGGWQKPYHVNPGVPYPPTTRTAYIPDTTEGRNLLKRLQFAFASGLTFTVGTSLTSGANNVITWASIHHKTSLYCGAHGYPDPSYFHNVNEELDALHVPPAEDIQL